jgi:hypothetical protein
MSEQGTTASSGGKSKEEMRAKKRQDLLLGFVAIAGMSLGLSISWDRDASLAGEIVFAPANAQDNDHNRGKDDDDGPATHVAKAECGRRDNPETGLQGQIPMPDRLAGFKGFNCNLEMTAKVSASRGDGTWQQFAYARDRAGHLCGYAGGTYFSNNPGTVVVDLTDPKHFVETAVLTTPAMITPGEGLRAHTGRGLLVSGNYGVAPRNDSVSHGFDVYDISNDCRHPMLLASTSSLMINTTGFLEYPGSGAWPNPDATYGHEGAFAPDGMTYYLSDFPHGLYHAIDLSDPRNPKLLASFRDPNFAYTPFLATPHGLSISNDGKRAYVASQSLSFITPNLATPTTGLWPAGYVIVDTSEIQERKPNPQFHTISTSYFYDAAATQMTIPVKIDGKRYLITSEEAGSGQVNTKGERAACAAGRTPFGMVRIHDIDDESSPRQIAKLVLEANDPTNCSLVDPEIGAGIGLLYDVHMCSVDDRDNATTLACSYFDSGIRVYDIRDPRHVKEIAYFMPPAKSAGAGIGLFGTGSGPAYCAAIPFLDASTGMLYSSCADTGILGLKITHDVWPFGRSKTPTDKQL